MAKSNQQSASKKKAIRNELTLVVKGQVTREALVNHFKEASEVTMQETQYDTGSKKKVAFVQMPSKKALDKYESNVMEAKPLMVAGQPMELDFYGERSQYKRNRTALDERCLHITGVPATASIDDVRALFPAAVDARFFIGKKGERTGMAVVEFENASGVASVMKKKQEVMIGGQKAKLDYMGSRSLRKKDSPKETATKMEEESDEQDENEEEENEEEEEDEEEEEAPRSKRQKVSTPKSTPKGKKAKSPKSAEKVKKVLGAKNKTPKKSKTA